MSEKIKRGRAKESASKVTAVCLTDELDAWLKVAAKRERKSQSKLVRDGLILLKQELEMELVTVFHNGVSNCDATFEKNLNRVEAIIRIDELAEQGIGAYILEDFDEQ